MPQYNGVSIMWYLNVEDLDTCFMMDASLNVCGGVSGQEYFRHRFPDSILHKTEGNIVCLEMFAIIVALRKWAYKFRGKRFTIACNNQACVQLINHGRTKNEVLQSCLREVAYITATEEILLHAHYIESGENWVPDYLSRWFIDRNCRRKFRELNDKPSIRLMVKEQDYQLSDQW